MNAKFSATKIVASATSCFPGFKAKVSKSQHVNFEMSVDADMSFHVHYGIFMLWEKPREEWNTVL